MSFADLKRNRKQSLDSLINEAEKINKPQTASDDDRFWRAEVDKSGNGYAVVRFLPPVDGEELPWVKTFNHGFQGPGGWYIENSLTTLNHKDPVSEYNTSLWNSGIEANKDIARKQKRRLTYFANVYIVKDPANPQNEGQIRLFKFGKRIFDKINDQMNPSFEDETPVNPFDFWEGANFKLKIRKVEGFTNYDKSEFDNSAPLFDDDEKMEELWAKQYSLQEFVDPTQFKTYDELKEKLNRVLGLTSETSGVKHQIATGTVPTPTPVSDDAPFDGGAPYKSTTAEGETETEGLAYFSKLAEE